MTDSQAHLTVEELAKHWRVDRRTVIKLIQGKLLIAHRVGRVIRISPEEVVRAEREHRLRPE